MVSDQSSSSKRIKVLFVLNTDVRLGGGVEKVVLNYIKYAPKDKFDITVLETDYLDQQRLTDEYVEETLKEVNVVKIRGYDHKFKTLSKFRPGLLIANTILIPILLNLLSATAYRNVIKSLEDIDVIYLFKNDYYRLFKKSRSTIIGSNHTGLANERSIANRIELMLIRKGIVDRRIDGFHLFPSKRKILPTLGKKHNLVLTNGVDTSKFTPSGAQRAGKMKFLFVGRLEPYKGILRLLDGWDKIKDKEGIELHVVGGGSLWKNVADCVDKSLIYHGILPDDELSKIYRDSDVFLYPTEWDSLPLVVLEALSSGIYAIVSSNMKGSFDDFESNGFLEYVENDPEAIATCVGEMRNRAEEIREKSERIHSYVKENYDWKPVTEKLFDFFESVSAARKR